jgi:hypothetical protein
VTYREIAASATITTLACRAVSDFQHRHRERVKAPAAAIDYARRPAQRRVPMVVLVRAYRIGHARFLQWCFDELLGQATARDRPAHAGAGWAGAAHVLF